MRLNLFLNVNFIIILINWNEDTSIINHIDCLRRGEGWVTAYIFRKF